MDTSGETWNQKFQRLIPGGSSTLSKSPKLLPEEPEAVVKGKGCRVWDTQGREFIDFRNGLGPITLGYQFPAVDEAIREQLANGIVFGHPHVLEAEVAELVCERIPCAEMVRFLKTGGEAMAAAIRLARYVTGREHIVQIGYNGWVNSLAAGGVVLPGQAVHNAPPGVPAALSALHHASPWNKLPELKTLFDRWPGQIAAVVVAADYATMGAGAQFYPALRELTRKNGALLVFDEIVTGFRVADGGVQQYFGVTPDLAVFSKGIANGMPLSAFVGKREYMSECNAPKVVVSTTFGGEALSLAAAKATMQVYQEQKVTDYLWKQGEKLWGSVNGLFRKAGIPIELRGFWPCPAFTPAPGSKPDLMTRFFRKAYAHGVSLYFVSYINFSHRDHDIEETIERLERVCTELAEEGI